SVAGDIRHDLGASMDISTVWNAVDLTRFTADGRRLDLDALAGLPRPGAEVVRVGLVATFARWKGHLTFLEVMQPLAAAHNVRAYIVGGPMYQTDGSQFTVRELRAAAARLGMESSVGFTGFVKNPAAALRSLDVVVHASTSPEPFGLVIAEAMACGRPVVVSNAGGAAEIVTPGVDALVHAPGDAGDLAAQIAALAGNPELRARIARAARVTAERSFD